MQHTEQRRQVRIVIETQECDLPRDEFPRIDQPLDDVIDVVGDLPGELKIKIVSHPQRQDYHVKAALSLPRRTLFTGDWDGYLDIALIRAIRKLKHKAAAYQAEPDHAADEVAQRVEQMNRDIVAPENPDMGPLGETVASGDYQAFHKLLADYEDWLRLRVGRWLERYPDAEAEVGRRVRIGDLVEEVLLTAFERFEGRSNDVPLSDWLDSLIDPALHNYCRHPAEERENISLVRSLRAEPPAEPTPSSPAAKKKPRADGATKKKKPARKKRLAAKRTMRDKAKANGKPKARLRKRARPAAPRKKKPAKSKVRTTPRKKPAKKKAKTSRKKKSARR